jgi:hypothetical protein
MLIPEKKILFVHVPKVAGQSMENALLRSLGKSREYHGASYLLRKNTDPTKGPPRLAHLTATQYPALGYLDLVHLSNYFKFGFVRNPWSRVVSFYHYSGLSSLINFECFTTVYLERLLEDQYWFYRPQRDFLYDEKNNLLVDFVGRFENINLDWEYCAAKMQISNVLKKENTTVRTPFLSRKTLAWFKRYPDLLFRVFQKESSETHYSHYYSQTSRAKVAELYQEDIALFGYQFEQQ